MKHLSLAFRVMPFSEFVKPGVIMALLTLFSRPSLIAVFARALDIPPCSLYMAILDGPYGRIFAVRFDGFYS